MRAFAAGPAALLQHFDNNNNKFDLQSGLGCLQAAALQQQRRYDLHLVPTYTI